MKRCVIMVSGGNNYRGPGQCRKEHGLRVVRLIDRRILICPHHQKVLERGRTVEISRPTLRGTCGPIPRGRSGAARRINYKGAKK